MTNPTTLLLLLASVFHAASGATDEQCGSMKLVSVSTSSSSTCESDTAGLTLHFWPTSYGADVCHGWEEIDEDGNVVNHSANNIACVSESELGWDEYNSIDCSGDLIGSRTSDDTCTATADDSELYTRIDFDGKCVNDGTALSGYPAQGQTADNQNPGDNLYKNGRKCVVTRVLAEEEEEKVSWWESDTFNIIMTVLFILCLLFLMAFSAPQ